MFDTRLNFGVSHRDRVSGWVPGKCIDAISGFAAARLDPLVVPVVQVPDWPKHLVPTAHGGHARIAHDAGVPSGQSMLRRSINLCESTVLSGLEIHRPDYLTTLSI
jgi:hypothetical protein